MRPDTVFDPMLQHERTALAWERTAIASMVSGTLLARRAADLHVSLAALGLLQVVLGAALLIWTGLRYEQLHAPLRRGESPAHPDAVRIIGLTTVGFCGAATVIAIASAMT
ncbi:MAG: DUF202 domain-containing protein [Ilumatobacter sp.]|nr:DUF202 domain-containing protein [bacterium]NKB39697.1 DUF202 domain-containing protein [Ilumatobacter sp.]